MKCCGDDLYMIERVETLVYVLTALCGDCGRLTEARAVHNPEYTFEQHRRVGVDLLKNRGCNGTLYIHAIRPEDLNG